MPKPIKAAVSKAFTNMKNSLLSLYNDSKETLENIVEKGAEKKNQQLTEDKVDLTPQKNKRVLKGVYKSFV